MCILNQPRSLLLWVLSLVKVWLMETKDFVCGSAKGMEHPSPRRSALSLFPFWCTGTKIFLFPMVFGLCAGLFVFVLILFCGCYPPYVLFKKNFWCDFNYFIAFYLHSFKLFWVQHGRRCGTWSTLINKSFNLRTKFCKFQNLLCKCHMFKIKTF